MTDQTAGTGETQTTQATETNATDTTSQTTDTVVNTTDNVITEPKGNEPWFPADWREKWAGGDEKALAQLKRHTSPDSVFRSYRELQTKLSSGQAKISLPENPTPEQMAEYRAQNDIPASPDDYKIELSDGLVIGESDEPLVKGILDRAFAENIPQKHINAVIDEFFHLREAQADAEAERAETDKVTLIDTLKGKWGHDFRPNMLAVNNLVKMAPDGLGDMILTARLADGTLLGNHIGATEWLASVAKELNPAGTIVPNQGGTQLESVQSELAALNAEMRSDINAWHKSPEKKARHLELLRAEEKLKGRGH